MKILNSITSHNEYVQSNSTDNTSNKKIDSSQNKNAMDFSESLLNITEENEKKILQHNENKKMLNKDLVDGVTYNPDTKKYTLVMGDYGLKRREFQHIAIMDNYTEIVSDKPITKEYLEERYKKIQHFIRTEYTEFNYRVSHDNSILIDIGIGMGGFGQRDAFGIVRIDGEYIEIDADEFDRHYAIYLNYLYEKATLNRESDHAASVYYKELNGIESSFENAEKFEYYINEEKWKSSDLNGLYRKISLAVNLGLIEEGNQTLFTELYQTDKATYIFRNIKNDILSQAVLDSIGLRYSSTFEGVLYEHLFGPDGSSFQNKLNEFVKELERNPSKYPSTNSNFTFTGDINIDKNSSEKYKNFITDTLIDFIQKLKDDYTGENNPIYDKLGRNYHFVEPYDIIIDNLKKAKKNYDILNQELMSTFNKLKIRNYTLEVRNPLLELGGYPPNSKFLS
ncbi:MAG: hypothetical protein HRT41_03025 [Campylobacteraceae bacterium]|nr:hypothetical protein [Campylobacteraceae bacterium]